MSGRGVSQGSRILCGLCVVLAALLLTLSPVAAKEYQISNCDIAMRLTGDGDYLITERITYDFREGTFSRGYRDVKGKGFRGLEFVSIKGVEQPVLDYDVKQGRNLTVNWTYATTSRPATFIITYKALGGLRSEGGRNIIDWNPVGSGWNVPLHDIDVSIELPPSVTGVKADPVEDVASGGSQSEAGRGRPGQGDPGEGGVVRFHRDSLPPKTYYHVIVSFPEIIAVETPPRPVFIWWVLLGIAAGLAVLMWDIRRTLVKRTQPAAEGPGPEGFSFAEMGSIAATNSNDKRRGIAATVFGLAQKGNIKLVARIRKGPLRTKRAEVEAEIVSDKGVSEIERFVLARLEDHGDLKAFARDQGMFSKGLAMVKDMLIDKGIVSREGLRARTKGYVSSILAAVLGAAALVYGLVALRPPAVGVALFLFIVWLGRLISVSLFPVLTAEGLYLKRRIREMLDKKKDVVEALGPKKPQEALERFFAHLPYLIMHPKFSSSTLRKYKKWFEKVESVRYPDWFVCDGSKLGLSLDAIPVIEAVDYMFVALYATVASTGAPVAGAGAAGSGAGGGGGGAS